jgi:hypothetical protein
MINKKKKFNFKKIIDIIVKTGFLFNNKQFSSNSINNSEFSDVSYAILGIKEFIRNLEIIKDVKLNKTQNRKKNGHIYVYIENSYIESIALLLLRELKFAKSFITICTLSKRIKKKENEVGMLLIIGSPNKTFFLEAIRNKINIIHVINTNFNQKITGIYHMYNDMSNITKIVFLFALIDNVFKQELKKQELKKK